MPGARSYSLAELIEASGFDRRTIVYYIQSGLLPKVGRRGPHTRYPEECRTRLLFIRGVKELQAGGHLLTATLAEIRGALARHDAGAIQALLDRSLPPDEVLAWFEEASEAQPDESRVRESPPAVPAPSYASPPPLPPSPATPQAAVSGPAGDRRSYGLADAGIRKRFGLERAPEAEAHHAEAHHDETHPRLPALPMAAAAEPLLTDSPPAAQNPPATEAGEGDLGQLLRDLEVRPTLHGRRSPPGSPEHWTEIPITSRVYLSVRGLAEDDAPLAEAVVRVLKRALRARTAPP